MDAELEHESSILAGSAAASAASPMRVFGSDGTGPSSRFQPEAASIPPKFTYINPFDALEAASPRNRTPVPEAPKATPKKVEILKPKHVAEASAPTVTWENRSATKLRRLLLRQRARLLFRLPRS
jgi:hypothetical protein